MKPEHTSHVRVGNRIGRSVIAVLVFAVTVYAKPGALDPSFGSGGKVTTNFSSTGDSGDFANAAAGLFGYIVAAGSSNAAGEDFALARYTPNGALDSTFGTGGKVTTDFGALTSDRAFAVAIDGSGRAVAAGVSAGNFALARYLLNGSLDVTFSGGTVTTSFGDDPDGFHINSFAFAVAIQADGKIVAAGQAGGQFALVRYNTSGTLDSTFGNGGMVTTNVGTPTSQIHAMVIQPDGRIVVAGVSSPEVSPSNFSNDTAIARYNTGGALDSTFGTGGIVTIDVTGTNEADLANAVALQSNGQIVVAGNSVHTTTTSNMVSFALVRLNVNGTLDGSFGTGGIVTTDFGLNSFSEATSLAVQANGKIVAGGYADVAGQDFALIRYQANGGLDPSFGVGGKTTTDFTTSSNTDDTISALVIQPNGKIVGVGTTDNDFALARYDK